jgi:hypothetical protein
LTPAAAIATWVGYAVIVLAAAFVTLRRRDA